jgi:hypothetical protein
MSQATTNADRMHISKGIRGGSHVCDVATPLKHASAENWEVETKNAALPSELAGQQAGGAVFGR